MSFKVPLPFDTSSILREHVSKISNLGLLVNKYVYTWSMDWKMKEGKKDFLNNIRSASYPASLKNIPTAIQIRQKNLCKSLEEFGWSVKQFELKTQTRLILGLGGTNVLETGMTLHPLYGFPYLPASGLKGLARAYAEITETLSTDQTLEIFGSEDKEPRNVIHNRQGKVVFLDGLPKNFPKLDLDVMNPHYGAYYQGEKDSRHNLVPPADYLNPVPIFFITVAAGETFSFAVLSREIKYAEKAEELLIKGLTELGAGGKTNVGYGYFQESTTAQTVKTHKIIVEHSKDIFDKQKLFEVEKKIFKDVRLIYSPGNRSLTTTVVGKKAFVEHIEDNFVPEQLWPKLKQHKGVKATIVVEPIGNAFKIVKVIE